MIVTFETEELVRELAARFLRERFPSHVAAEFHWHADQTTNRIWLEVRMLEPQPVDQKGSSRT